MRRNLKIVALTALSVTLVGISSAMADEDLTLSQVPPAVQATVKKVVGGNKLVSMDSDVDNGKRVYEVDAEGKFSSYSVHISASGAVLGISLDIPMEIVPSAVTDAATKAYPSATLKEPEIRTDNGQMLYKLEVMVGKVKHEMLVNASGKVSSDEVDKEGADDDAKTP